MTEQEKEQLTKNVIKCIESLNSALFASGILSRKSLLKMKLEKVIALYLAPNNIEFVFRKPRKRS